MASYGVVKMPPGGPGTGYQGLGWEPKLAFGALARAGSRSQSAAPQAGKAGHAVYWDQEGLTTVVRKAGGAGRAVYWDQEGLMTVVRKAGGAGRA